MVRKPTYEELEQRVKEFEGEVVDNKKVHEALRKSEERYRGIFDESIAAVYIFDEKKQFIDSNQAGLDLLGYSRDELLSMSIPDVDADPVVVLPAHKQLLSGESIVNYEHQLRRKDGMIITVLNNSRPLSDAEGNIIGMQSTLFDITERKQAEEELKKHRIHLEEMVVERTSDLRKSNEELKREITERKRVEEELLRITKAVENSSDAIGMSDPHGHHFYQNRAFTNLFEYSAEELDVAGGGPTAYADPAVAQDVFKEIMSGRSWIGEVEMVSKSGHKFPVFLRADAIKDELGNIIGLVGIHTDITERKLAAKERKKLEAQLQHVQKLESIGTLTSGVAHNFRNILSPISLHAQLIQMTHKDDPQLQEMTEKTIQCVKRGAQLVDGLMQFSRKHTKELETIDLAEVIRGTYDLITESFDKKIDIRIDIAGSLPIRGGYSGLSQVFMNLCTNARDAMLDGGELLIETRREGNDASITITDTGPGMDEQTRRQCFDPFFTTKEVGKGTGLGLSTAYGIVKDHGGEIHVFSGLNKGTTFKLYFPLAVTDEHQRQAGVHEILQGSGEKVLIVDDEVDILEALVMLAERLGYRAASAESGKAGIDNYKSWQPDVVLLDRNMPGMDGLRCARSILEYDPGARIVLISGYDEGGPSGIDDKTKTLIKWYLTKPINMEEISQTIWKVLDKN